MPKIFHSRRRSILREGTRRCFFCTNKIESVGYKDSGVLSRFLSSRAKIVPRTRNGLCARHQKQVGRAIKIARVNALLPFKENLIS